jgi:hypothetical protein
MPKNIAKHQTDTLSMKAIPYDVTLREQQYDHSLITHNSQPQHHTHETSLPITPTSTTTTTTISTERPIK